MSPVGNAIAGCLDGRSGVVPTRAHGAGGEHPVKLHLEPGVPLCRGSHQSARRASSWSQRALGRVLSRLVSPIFDKVLVDSTGDRSATAW